jgi:hypothetical protein
VKAEYVNISFSYSNIGVSDFVDLSNYNVIVLMIIPDFLL